jgi:hypothetical protein
VLRYVLAVCLRLCVCAGVRGGAGGVRCRVCGAYRCAGAYSVGAGARYSLVDGHSVCARCSLGGGCSVCVRYRLGVGRGYSVCGSCLDDRFPHNFMGMTVTLLTNIPGPR